MQIKIDFFKRSGKWYAGGFVEIPNSSNLFDKNILDIIDSVQSIVINPRQFIYVVDATVDDGYFFKGILNLNNEEK